MSYTHIEDRHIKARKTYRCGLCGHAIEKGEMHIARISVGGDSGGFITFRMHGDCERVTKGWDEFRWECDDEWEFKKELAEMLKLEGEVKA